jgi:S1-C subfamily serine protease
MEENMRINFFKSQLQERARWARKRKHLLNSCFYISFLLFISPFGYFIWQFYNGNLPDTKKNPIAVAKVHSGGNTGSAFIINEQMALTAAHVVGNQSSVILDFPKAQQQIQANVVFKDHRNDLALLQLQENISDIKPLELGDSDLIEEGEALLIAGYTGGGLVLNESILSMKNNGLFKTNAANNPGNIGGPAIYKEYNAVIGIIVSSARLSANQRSEGIHYILPINNVIDILMEKGYSIQ